MSLEPPSYDSLFESSPDLPSPSSLVGLDPDEMTQIEATDSYRDLLTLPDDVVSQIFIHACQPILDHPRWKREFYPLWLGKICRAWRESAWVCSELWTNIDIRIQRDDIHSQMSLLRPWIERAKGRPLNIYVDDSYHPRGPFTNALLSPRMAMLALLSRHSRQWRRIDLHLPYEYFSSTRNPELAATKPSTHPFLHLSLPLLRHVSISIPNGRKDGELHLDMNQAPLLHTLSITSFLETNLLSRCPTKQITHLVLSSCRRTDLKDLLKQFPKLTQLTWTNNSPSRLPVVPVLHDRLQCLDIGFGNGSYHSLFRSISLPALRSLSIRTHHAFGYTQMLQPFLQQSGCALAHLTLECQLKSEHDLIDLLSSESISSSLQELYVRHIPPAPQMQFADQYSEFGLSRTFFDNLHPDEDPTYLTRLETLEYEGPLTVQAIDFIEPLIIRSRIRDVDSPRSTMDGMAILKRAKIKADQFSAVSEFSIAEYTDSQYVWEVFRMLEEGVLVLSNTDGSMWE